MVKRTWFALWMLRVRITRIPVVRTRHNLEPHDGTTGVEGLLLRSLTSLSRGDVWLSDSSRAQAGVDPGPRNVVIPHGDYAPWIARIRPGVNLSRTPGPTVRLVGLGAIKRYKNFEEAIVGVSGCEDFTLTIAGNDSDHAYLASLQSLAAETNNVVVQPGRLEDGPLIDLALASDATLLTYESLYNSGVVFLALSLGRPVIARDGPMTRELRDEYGPEWIGLYEGRLTPAGLRAAWKSVAPSHAVPIGSPQRAWPQIAREHERLYRWALTSAG
jgi:beta-1,4-mannosyltransferase